MGREMYFVNVVNMRVNMLGIIIRRIAPTGG